MAGPKSSIPRNTAKENMRHFKRNGAYTIKPKPPTTRKPYLSTSTNATSTTGKNPRAMIFAGVANTGETKPVKTRIVNPALPTPRITNLPRELLLHIFALLDAQSATCLGLACWRFYYPVYKALYPKPPGLFSAHCNEGTGEYWALYELLDTWKGSGLVMAKVNVGKGAVLRLSKERNSTGGERVRVDWPARRRRLSVTSWVLVEERMEWRYVTLRRWQALKKEGYFRY